MSQALCRHVFVPAVAKWLFILSAGFVSAAEPLTGHHADVKIDAPTRIDWVFALANQSVENPPAEWLEGYDAAAVSYELYVPPSIKADRPAPLLLFISAGQRGTGQKNWQAACDALGMIFASPHAAGNNIAMPRRIRTVLDVLDDVRKRYKVDAQRTYIGGFSGGGRVACAIAFSLPEYFGGAVPVCAAGDVREEPWLRHRVIEKLSVAHITGENDFNRGEVERYRSPMLAGVGIRSKAWVVNGMGHSIPSGDALLEAVRWLDEGSADRRKLAEKYPASTIAGDAAPSRAEWAQLLLAEGKQRAMQPATLYSGLSQLIGVRTRWDGVPAAAEATKILLEYEAKQERPWEADDIAEQRRFLLARARSLDAYASGELPPQYANQRSDMAQGAINLWGIVIQDGSDARAVEEAKRRIPELQKLVEK